MSREGTSFQVAFDGLASALNRTPTEVAGTAQLQTKCLDVFNRAYRRGYNKRSWEDAWDGDNYTPASGFVDFSGLKDARRFEVWSADPRPAGNSAYGVRYTTTKGGLTLTDGETSVFILSMPKARKFTTIAWDIATTYASGATALFTDGHVYESLQDDNTGHSPDTEADWWQVVPVLDVLLEFTMAYASGTYLLETGKEQAGAQRRSDALIELEDAAKAEYFRLAKAAWRPKP
ncbi:hypothetical protein [Prosthecobacter sp.]|uniref:hypothetical protein n=1 Tax=Prosthecobacter sp. TaxID=1965333 RepID=UPI00378428D7